jgi:hypothetical protein
MDILENLFGSALKARIIRAFINNPDTFLDTKTLIKKVKANKEAARKELKLLEKIKLIRKKEAHVNGRTVSGFILNQNFKFINPLREFLMSVSPLTEDAMAKKLGDKGKAKLVVISGMFLDDNEDARADMLIVSEKQNERAIQKTIADIGAEFGREVSYALFTKDDFSYRLNMGDKLIRDIFDFPHKVILDKLGIGK